MERQQSAEHETAPVIAGGTRQSDVVVSGVVIANELDKVRREMQRRQGLLGSDEGSNVTGQ